MVFSVIHNGNDIITANRITLSIENDKTRNVKLFLRQVSFVDLASEANILTQIT